MTLAFISLILFANTAIAAVVFYNNKKSTTNLLLAFLSIINALWTLFTYLALSSAAADTRLFWVRSVMFVTSAFGPVIYLLAKSFPKVKLQISKVKLMLSLFFSVVTAIVALTPFMFRSLENLPNGNFQLSPGLGILLYGITLICFMFAGFITLFQRFKRSKGIEKRQFSYFIWGLVFTFTLATLTNFIAVVVFKTMEFAYLGPASTLILVSFVAYAIVKHKLFDIRVLIVRLISYFLLSVIILVSYVTLVFTATKFLPVEINRIFVYSILSLLISFTFNPIRNYIKKITDKIFFKDSYEIEKLLFKLTHVMATEFKVKTMGNKLLTILTKDMRLTSGSFVFVSENKIQNIELLNFKKNIFDNDQLLSFLKGKQEKYIFEELADESIKNLFRKLNISVILPLKVKTIPIGLLILGPKSSGEVYSEQDLELLGIFAPQASIALQNAESFRKIRNFNQTLERKIEERTVELKKTQHRALAKAKELLKIKDEFVFIATHDLGTPITAIKGFTYLLELEENKLSKSAKENLSALKEAGDRLSILTNDLLQVARSESGVIIIETKKVDIIKLINNIVKEVLPHAKQRDVKISINFHAKECFVMADEKKLAEVMENLLSNSVKYNKEKGTVSVVTKTSNGKIKVDISDTGIGIAKKDYKKVFQKFSRLNQVGTEEISGTGLGLFVVRMLIEKMKGKISFTSEENKGTTFSFMLPLSSDKLINSALKKVNK